MRIIVHYVFRDVFTAGYIEFMINSMTEFDHVFILKKKSRVFKHGINSGKGDELKVNPSANIIFVDSDYDLYENFQVHCYILDCDKFIISGVFDDLTTLLRYSDSIWKKTYLHFWGGDFYCFRSEKMSDFSPKRLHNKELLREAIKRCAAVLTVLDNDYNQLAQIMDVEKTHFEAPMPENIDTALLPAANQNSGHNSNLRIVIGNSASPANCHIEIFHQLSWLCGENVEVFCPLSYGEKDYREQVMAEGSRIFGNKITFLTEFLTIEKYSVFLASCDVGIYNNNRQQGFKNITMMLCMGKKVFLREGTAVWKKLKELDIQIFSTRELTEGSLSVFQLLELNDVRKNALHMKTFIESYQSSWQYILDDKSRYVKDVRSMQPVPFSIHLTDHCNLNCKGCSHFAPVAKTYYLDENELIDTLKKIRNISDKVMKDLSLMGGEPLLHPNCTEIINLCRQYLPDIPLILVTNGINLRSMDDRFWTVCRVCSVKIKITYYPIHLDYEALINFSHSKHVDAEVYVDRRDGTFRMDVIEPEGTNNIYSNYARCRNGGVYPQIKNGYLFRCSTAANSHILNEAFGTALNIDHEDYIPLDNVTNESIRRFLTTPSSFCRYCNIKKQRKTKWEVSSGMKEEWGM